MEGICFAVGAIVEGGGDTWVGSSSTAVAALTLTVLLSNLLVSECDILACICTKDSIVYKINRPTYFTTNTKILMFSVILNSIQNIQLQHHHLVVQDLSLAEAEVHATEPYL